MLNWSHMCRTSSTLATHKYRRVLYCCDWRLRSDSSSKHTICTETWVNKSWKLSIIQVFLFLHCCNGEYWLWSPRRRPIHAFEWGYYISLINAQAWSFVARSDAVTPFPEKKAWLVLLTNRTWQKRTFRLAVRLRLFELLSLDSRRMSVSGELYEAKYAARSKNLPKYGKSSSWNGTDCFLELHDVSISCKLRVWNRRFAVTNVCLERLYRLVADGSDALLSSTSTSWCWSGLTNSGQTALAA